MRVIATLYRNDDQDAMLYDAGALNDIELVNFGWLCSKTELPVSDLSPSDKRYVLAKAGEDAEEAWRPLMAQEPDLEWGIGVHVESGRERLRQQVFAALDNAIDNGYTFEHMTATEVAIDLADYDADLEHVSVLNLIPWITIWSHEAGNQVKPTDLSGRK